MNRTMKILAPTVFILLICAIFTYWNVDRERNEIPQRETNRESGKSKPKMAQQPPIFKSEGTHDTVDIVEIRSNPRWLDPIILNTTSTETSWNETGTQKTVTSIVESDFHHPRLRVEEVYSVDPKTGQEALISYIPSTADSLLIEFTEGITVDKILDLEDRYGFSVQKKLRGTDIFVIALNDFNDPGRIPLLIDLLNSESDTIALAEPDYLVRALRKIPNDPKFESQAGLDFSLLRGQNRDIDAPEAWDIRTDAPGVVVAIIDSGIYLEHEDLVDNLWQNSGESSNGIDDDNNGIVDDLHGANFIDDDGDPSDDNEHGTLVAGTIGASGNNAIGIAGVAWDVQLMGLKFLDSKGIGQSSDAIECIQYAVSQQVDIINNSWGGFGPSNALKRALEEASEQGIIIVTAAGNNGNRLSDVPAYPAAFRITNQVVVGSSNFDNNLSAFSNFDEELVHLVAPEGTYSTWIHPGGTYDYETGTSYSAPYVTGALALLIAEFPDSSEEALISRMLDATEVMDSFSKSSLSQGRLNIHRALIGASNIPANDSFSNAQKLDPLGESTVDSLTKATLEIQEPEPYQNMDPNTVWYQWTSPRSDAVNISLRPPGFSGTIAVYSGASINQLSLIASGISTATGLETEIQFDSTEGANYFIQIGRVSGSGGFFNLTLALAPPNDSISAALELPEGDFEIAGSMALATEDTGEPRIHPSGAGNSVWYKWTPNKDGSFFLTVEASFGQTFVSVFEGTPESLTAVNFQQDQGLPNRLLFDFEADKDYFFGVDSQAESGGQFTLKGQILVAPRITVQPPDIETGIGRSVQFNVAVLGTGQATYQWFKDQNPIPDATQPFLLLGNIQEKDVGSYFVEIVISGIQLRSRTASLTVIEESLQILEHPQPKIVTAGSTINLSVFAQPEGLVTYAWFKNGEMLVGQSGPDLRIPNASLQDSASYRVVVGLNGGTLSSKSATVRVVDGDSIFSGTVLADTPFGEADFLKIQRAGDRFFAFGNEKRLAFSTDGSFWNYTSIPSSGYFRGITFGKGVYVISGSSNLYWSTDLFNWERGSGSRGGQVAFGNGVFVAGGAADVLRSTDGKTWDEIDSPKMDRAIWVVWGEDRFYVGDFNNNVFTSTNGIDWQQIGTANKDLTNLKVIYGGGNFWTTASIPAHSTDGVNWTELTLPQPVFRGITYDPDSGKTFLLTSSALWEWEGESWAHRRNTPLDLNMWGLAMDGNEPITIIDRWPQRLSAHTGQILQEDRIMESYFANGKFGVWSGDRLYESSDGVNWNFVNTNLQKILYRGLVYGNNLYVSESAYGESLSSMTEHGLNLGPLEFGNGVFVGYADLRMQYSTNGQTWSIAEGVQSSPQGGLIFENGRFLSLDSNGIWTSTNGSSWTEQTGGSGFTPDHFAAGNGIFLSLHQNGRASTSSNGINWQRAGSITYPNLSSFVDDLEFFNGKFYATYHGFLYESTNGSSWKLVNKELHGYDANFLESGNDRLLLFSDIGIAVWNTEADRGGGSRAPILNISGVTSGSTVMLGETLSLSTKAFARGGAISKFEVFENESLITRFEPPVSTFQYTVSTPGIHVLTVRVTDSNDQTTEKTFSIKAVRNLVPQILGGDPLFGDITYFQGAYYGTGPSGLVFQSIDGEQWNRIQTPATEDLSGFYHNDIGICATSESGELLFSKDGIHWIKIPLEDARWGSRTFEPSFLAIPTGFDIAWLSTNGTDWYSMRTGLLAAGNPGQLPVLPYEFVGSYDLNLGSPGKPFKEVAGAGNTVKLGNCVYFASPGQGVFKSEDGVSWQTIQVPGSENVNRAILQSVGNALFFINDRHNTRQIISFSGNGTDWEAVNRVSCLGNIVYKEGSFYCGDSQNFYRSGDGINWERIGNGPFPENIVGRHRELISSPRGFLSSAKTNSGTAEIRFSEKGKSWQIIEKPYTGSEVDVVVGGDGNVFAKAWIHAFSLGASGVWKELEGYRITAMAAWGNGVFLDQSFVEPDIRRSSDGLNWSEVSLPEWLPKGRPDAIFHDGKSAFWMIYHYDKILARSVDGLTWEPKTFPGSLKPYYRILQFNGKLFASEFVSEDNGESWTNAFPETDQVQAARTSTHLLAVARYDSQPNKAFRYENNEWVETGLPELQRSDPLIFSSNDTFYYVGLKAIYSSGDGSEWMQIAQGPRQSSAASTGENVYFFGPGRAILVPSQSDLAIDSVQTPAGEFGVGDQIELSVLLRNAGDDTISLMNSLELEILLSQRPNAWGSGVDGHHVATKVSMDSISLSSGESRLVNTSISIPDTIKPGDYFISVHIVNSPLLLDSISGNDFWLGDSASIRIPERKLSLTVEGNGTVFSEKPVIRIPNKQQLQLIPKAALGHEFSRWTGDVAPHKEVAELTMDSDKSVGAMFEERLYRIEIAIEGGGTVAGSPLSVDAPFGDQLEYSVVADDGWEFLGWFGDRQGTGETLTIEAGRDLQLIARFGQRIGSWLAEQFTEEERDNPEIGGLLGDPDADGYTNLQEFLFGLDPETGELPLFEIFVEGDEICLIYPRSRTTAGPEYLEVRYSRNLSEWTTEGLREEELFEEDGLKFVKVTLTKADNDRVFFEIRAISD